MKKKLHCILLIDDNSDDNFFHKIVIKKMNITEHIEVAMDVETAINFLTRENQILPELIFLDINMPKMNGWEFLEEYNKLSAAQKTAMTIIMLTTSTNPEDRKRAGQLTEIAGFNSKPLTEEMMNEILENYFSENKNETK